MKKLILSLSILVTLKATHAQQAYQAGMEQKPRNLTSVTPAEKKVISDELNSLTPIDARNNPDYGVMPETSPCTDCIELIQKRTENTRYYVKKGTKGGKFFKSQGYFPINYRDDNGFLRAINERLKPDATQPKLYTAPSQQWPTKIDFGNKLSSLTNSGKEFKFNQNLRLLHKDAIGNITVLGNADWSNYTVGSDGALITNIFPKVDLKIRVFEGIIKTDFIVKQSLGLTGGGWLIIEDDMGIPAGMAFSTANAQLNPDGQWVGNIDLVGGNNPVKFTINEGFADDNTFGNPQRAWLGYKFYQNKFEIYLPVNWLADPARQYPVTIDPTVQTSGTNVAINGAGAGYDNTFVTGCFYSLSVNTPANCTITNIYWWAQYTTFNPCFGGNGGSVYGGIIINYLACVSPPPGQLWGCAFNGPVICNPPALPGLSCAVPAANGNFLSCVPAPQCAPYAMNFTMNFVQGNYPAFTGCNPACYRITSNWVMTIEGETVVQPPTPSTSSGATICNGMCTVLTATPNWGVPPYTYSWSPTGGTINPSAAVCPPPNAATIYTCVITDLCGITAINTVTITTQPMTLAVPTFSTFMNPSTGSPCPVTVTACSTLPTNYGGGSENYSWLFSGGSVTSGGALSGSASGPTYGGAGTSTLCGGGQFYEVVYNTAGTYTLSVQIVKGTGCATWSKTISITCPVILPIELVDYKVNYSDNLAKISWQTATEYNSDYFILEKSYDGEKFEQLAKVAAAGISSTKKNYLVDDPSPNKKGVTYYRLTQFDKGLTDAKFSQIITLNISDKLNELLVIPNPANSNVMLIIPDNLFGKLVYIDIYDNTGRKVMEAKSEITRDNNSFSFNVSNLPDGIYFIKASDNLGTIIRKNLIKE